MGHVIAPQQQGNLRPMTFSLVRWFAVLSLISIALASALSAYVLSRFLSDQMLRREAVMMMDFVNGVIAVERADKNHSGPVAWLDGDIAEFFYHIGGLPDVLKANVYRPDGTIVWSTDSTIIGQRFARNDDLEVAFAGTPMAHIDEIARDNPEAKDEHAYLGLTEGAKFIESYLPVTGLDAATGQVVGVLEIYHAPKGLFATIDAGVRRVWVSAFLGAAIIYVALFGIVLRASKTIARQQREIVANEMLAAVGEMASAVAHSLRNPLASVRSSAELALATTRAAEKDAALGDILRDADRLELWIRQYLSDTQAQTAPDAMADVRDSIEQTMNHFQVAFARAGIRAELRCDNDLPSVRPSGLTLIQVLTGLVANAIEAMPAGGTLSISAIAEQAGDQVRILLEDTGTGLPAENETAAFEAFATTKQNGFGLGLPLARRVIARYGGQLTLANRAERGAVATLLLPAAG